MPGRLLGGCCGAGPPDWADVVEPGRRTVDLGEPSVGQASAERRTGAGRVPDGCRPSGSGAVEPSVQCAYLVGQLRDRALRGHSGGHLVHPAGAVPGVPPPPTPPARCRAGRTRRRGRSGRGRPRRGRPRTSGSARRRCRPWQPPAPRVSAGPPTSGPARIRDAGCGRRPPPGRGPRRAPCRPRRPAPTRTARPRPPTPRRPARHSGADTAARSPRSRRTALLVGVTIFGAAQPGGAGRGRRR